MIQRMLRPGCRPTDRARARVIVESYDEWKAVDGFCRPRRGDCEVSAAAVGYRAYRREAAA
jgi:hypothetical protein